MARKAGQNAVMETESVSGMARVLASSPDEIEGAEDTHETRCEFVKDLLKAGWTRGAIKNAYRSKYGPTTNSEMEYLFRVGRDSIAVAIEADSDTSHALELFRVWTLLGDIVYGQIRSRERLHKKLGIPAPAEMLGLKRQWGHNPPEPAIAIKECDKVLDELRKLTTSSHD